MPQQVGAVTQPAVPQTVGVSDSVTPEVPWH